MLIDELSNQLTQEKVVASILSEWAGRVLSTLDLSRSSDQKTWQSWESPKWFVICPVSTGNTGA